MPLNSPRLQQSTIRFLWSGMLAASLLYVLAAWNIGNKVDQLAATGGHKGAVVAADIPLHVTSEHSPKLQRFFNQALSRIKDQPTLIEPPAPIWGLTTAEIIPPLLLAAANQPSAYCSASLIQQKLHMLNSPRAPPIV